MRPEPVPSRPSRRRTRSAALLTAGVVATSALVLAAGPASAAAPSPTVLDRHADVFALASDTSSAAWLAKSDHGSTSLVVREPGKAPRTVAQKLPAHTSDLAIGSDAKGRSTVVLVAGPKASPRLWSLPADGSAAPTTLDVPHGTGGEDAPGLRHGVLTYAKTEKVRGRTGSTIHLGHLRSKRTVRVFDGAPHSEIESTVPTANDGVAFVRSDTKSEWGAYDLRIMRVGHSSKQLERTAGGGAAEAGFGPLVVTPGGTKLEATRWTDDQRSHAWDVTTYAAPSGKQLSRHHPSEDEYFAGADVADGRVYTVLEGDGKDALPEGALVFRPSR